MRPGHVTIWQFGSHRQVVSEVVGSALDRVRHHMDDDDAKYLPPQRPARRPGQQPTARLTLEAYVRLRKELEQLETQGRDEVAERLLRAREHGAIRENADYDAAKNDQGLMEAKIR